MYYPVLANYSLCEPAIPLKVAKEWCLIAVIFLRFIPPIYSGIYKSPFLPLLFQNTKIRWVFFSLFVCCWFFLRVMKSESDLKHV